MLSYTSQRPTGVDNSWAVRAFSEDTGSPPSRPRTSYTCSFCGREFRSAQALGGHMNVHRQDRARLRQLAREGETSNRMHVPGGGTIFYPISTAAAGPTLVPVAANFRNPPVPSSLLDRVGVFIDHDDGSDNSSDSSADGTVVEELDLELRLGPMVLV